MKTKKNEMSSLVKSISGVIRLKKEYDGKKDHVDYLIKKYK